MLNYWKTYLSFLSIHKKIRQVCNRLIKNSCKALNLECSVEMICKFDLYTSPVDKASYQVTNTIKDVCLRVLLGKKCK